MNIFGDINQRSSVYGIDSWGELARTLEADMLELCEKYRNTTEIVDFYNKDLGMNDKSIGLDNGEQV